MSFPNMTTSYGKNGGAAESHNPYARAAAAWDDRIGSARVQARNWRYIAFASMALALISTSGAVVLGIKKQVATYIVEVDIATPSTESTSILTEKPLIGKMKTRSMAAWCGHRGFNTSIYERRFDDSFRLQSSEPTIALCGIDNALGRKALDQVGFGLIVEAGLGRGHRDFRTIRLHTLPGSRKASDIWRQDPANAADVSDNEAYQRLLREGTLDQCGVTLLAGKAVGAPFVGMAAASIAIAEVLRQLHGGKLYQLIDTDLVTIEHRTVVPHPFDFAKLNPGFISLT